VTRDMVKLTFRSWGMLSEFDVDETLNKARDNPGTPQRLHLSSTWWADVTYGGGDYALDESYTLTQGRTMT
jgi:hypothetical protein